MRVCMIVKNSFEYDARVEREARTLAAAGHDVTVVALRSATTPAHEVRDGVTVLRVARPGTGLYRRLRAVLGGGVLPARPATATPGDDTGAEARASRGGAPTAVAGRLAPLLRAATALLAAATRGVRVRLLDRAMYRTAAAVRADVYHCHDLNTLHIGLRCRGPGGRVVYDAHELHAHRSRASALQRWRAQRRERRLIRRCDGVITSSPDYARLMARTYGIAEPTVLLNVPEVPESIRPRPLREELAIPPEHHLVIYQGSVQEHRGIEQVIAALPALPDVHLVVVGYGHHLPAVAALCREVGVEDRVHLIGPVPHHELLEFTAAADVGACLIVPSSLSYRLSAPNKLFEYVVAGIPVLGAAEGFIGRFIREHDVGEACDPTDVDQVAASLRRLLEPSRYERCRANAQRISGAFRWAAHQQVLLDLYAALT